MILYPLDKQSAPDFPQEEEEVITIPCVNLNAPDPLSMNLEEFQQAFPENPENSFLMETETHELVPKRMASVKEREHQNDKIIRRSNGLKTFDKPNHLILVLLI